MTNVRTSAALVLLLALCACKVGPNYKRPHADRPWRLSRGCARRLHAAAAAGEQFAEMKWPAVYQDEVLQGLIKEALANNYDMRIAATRILQANANLGHHPRQSVPHRERECGITNERNNFFPGAPTFDTVGIQLELHRRFLGTISPGNGSSTGHAAGDRIRTERGSNHADLVGGQRLLPAASIRLPAGVLATRRSRPTRKS